MKKLILLMAVFLISCGKKNEEQETAGAMCLDSCIDRNLSKVNNNKLDATNYCNDFVLPKVKCYTMNNETFYYR